MKTKKRPSRIYGYILHQIINEKRSNWALLAELLIVSCVVWYLVDCAYVMIVRTMEPTGFDTTNCYRLDIGRLDEKAVGYDASCPLSNETRTEDMVALIERLRHDEDIEAAAFSLRNDPCGNSKYMVSFNYDTIQGTQTVCFYEPDFLRVFRIRSVDGKSPEQLAALLKDRNMFASEGLLGEDYDMVKQIGKEMTIYTDDNLPRKLVAVLPPMKKSTTEEMASSRIVVVPFLRKHITEGYTTPALSIRVKDERVQGFAERFREKIKNKGIRAGNHYISGINSYKDLIADDESEQDMKMRFYGVAIVFLLVNVFLGLLGTFWFRTQHRFPEIGLQKTFGATNTDITLRLLFEAVLLLTIAFVPSLLIDLNIAYAGLTEPYNEATLATGRFITCAAISYALMLLIIGLGIWFPALKAVKAEPVEVLKCPS